MIEALTTLIIVTALLMGSPGPAPLTLAATSATFGVRKTTPFLTGILFGLLVAIFGAIFGVAVLFKSFPDAKIIVQFLGASYLIFIAYKISISKVVISSDGVTSENRPSFLDGFILNLLNPKAYAAFFAIFSQFLLPFESIFISFLVTATVSFIVSIVVDLAWVLLGGVLKNLFDDPKSRLAVRRIFGVLIILVVCFTLIVSLE